MKRERLGLAEVLVVVRPPRAEEVRRPRVLDERVARRAHGDLFAFAGLGFRGLGHRHAARTLPPKP